MITLQVCDTAVVESVESELYTSDKSQLNNSALSSLGFLTLLHNVKSSLIILFPSVMLCLMMQVVKCVSFTLN